MIPLVSIILNVISCRIFTNQPHGENTSGAYLGKGFGSLQEKVMERRNRWDVLTF